MKSSISAGPHLCRLWLVGALALWSVTGCATAGGSEAGPTTSDPVDIGYGEVEQEQITGSVGTVEGRDDESGRPRTLVEMLSRVAGVRVSEGAYGEITVRIRGTSSFLGGQEPLFVVDGVVMPSAEAVLRNLNPNQIDSISVLKDAGQTAMYGSRGANGVVLIRMKSGIGED
jgi:TonB-dependent SusC/RagA subfamily outer membrane receptor